MRIQHAAGIVLASLSTTVAARETVRVSVSSAGAQGDDFSAAPSISADGRFVAFHSGATNLVERDSNGQVDVLVRDRIAGTTERASVSAHGGAPNGESSFASISGDGRFVAFRSLATNLVAGDTNGVADVFVRDLVAGSTVRASVSTSGVEADGPSDLPAISADGRFVAFTSRATNLVAGDVDGFADVFVHDLASGETTIVSVSSSGALPDRFGVADGIAISADGRFVAFQHLGSNLVGDDVNGVEDVFVRDRDAGTTTRVSVASTGEPGDGRSGLGRIGLSADGRFVAFASDATNLDGTDLNGFTDVFVHDVQSHSTWMVSVGPHGEPGNAPSYAPSLSSDGRFVAFLTSASTFASTDSNALGDVYVRDLGAGTISCASIAASGGAADGESYFAAMAADGREVAFISYATNLVSDDTNGRMDVFARDLQPCRRGTVGSRTGMVSSVLSVNGATAFAPVDVGTPISVALSSSPSGPSSARYALWIWHGSPARATDLVPGGGEGCTIGPTPLASGAPQPFACLRGGAPLRASQGIADLDAPARAPWSRSLASATRATTFTLQGVIEDAGSSGASGFSATNAVLVSIQ